MDHHSEQQLARGFLPYRHRQGCCEVRGGLANLWHAAARALGFEIGNIRCPDPLLVRQVSTLCPGVKSLAPLPWRLRPPQHLLDTVFSDLGSIPLSPDLGEYWGAWPTPHLFFLDGTDDGVAAAAGPRARVWVEPLTWEPRGGTPLLCCVNDRVAARPFLGTRRSGVGGNCVKREDGLVMDFGLFTASDLMARVLLESSGALQPAYGLPSLSARELGDLWDVPILFMDSLSDQDVGDLMGAICRTPPSKLLHSGAVLLLMSCFRGGLVGVLQGQGCLQGPRPVGK